ncbi:trypsin-1-like [Galleria mellonella]|uniref:trypsin n=1 Tax=Galleria mellonella TaxID=7137 RepID=A0ABM3MNQ8_GALME|nr:trypsin-1-like [Galleria mellonella]
MVKVFVVFICVFYYILPAYQDKYDVIIIPVPKQPNVPLRSKKVLEVSVPKRLLLKNPFRKDDFYKLDIENYDAPTELPDIDNFDYTKDRDEHPKRIGDYDENSNEMQKSVYGEDKIVGGFEVDINLYPYHVAYGTNCGGAIIDKKWVITAGHCGKKPYVRIGSKYLNQGRKVMVKHNHVHPIWGKKVKEHPFDYDFQLLELNENLKFDENVQPVKIAHIEDMVIGKVVTVTGWGNTEENGPYSNVLRAVRVPIISKENCQNVPFPYFRGSLTARMFCAGFSEGKKDACQGDSGGPAVAHDRILGMVSFGYGCATPGSYGVYSKIAKVRPWIEQTTKIKFD